MKTARSSLCWAFFLSLAAFYLLGCAEDPYVEKFREAQKFKYQTDETSLRKAVEEYEEAFLYAVESLNGKYEALKSLGIILSYDKKFSEAIRVLEEARLGRDQDSEIYYHLGFCYLNLAKVDSSEQAEQIEKAKKEFEQGIALDKENDSLYYGLGVLYGFMIKDLTQALFYLNVAYELNNRNINTLFALANIHYQQGNEVLAKNFYREIIDNFPDKKDKVAKAQENLARIDGSF